MNWNLVPLEVTAFQLKKITSCGSFSWQAGQSKLSNQKEALSSGAVSFFGFPAAMR